MNTHGPTKAVKAYREAKSVHAVSCGRDDCFCGLDEAVVGLMVEAQKMAAGLADDEYEWALANARELLDTKEET